jgi:2'-5' RNA ligase
MRLFLALELTRATADDIVAAVAPLRGDSEPRVSWVSAPKLHLTVKFIGDADDSRVAALIGAVDDLAARHRPFEMELAGVGAFPNFRRPRVVWMGVASEPRLELLHHDVELAAADAGYEVDGRPFRPHVTLGRVRDPMSADQARTIARAARTIAFCATTLVDRLTLFDSASAGPGARYRRLHAATLGGR